MTTGKIKWFNSAKGYGFIEQEGKDVFLHVSALEKAGIDTLKEGEEIEFEIGENKGRENAIMAGVASLLSEQDMFDIAAYYSIQTISENSAKADEETIELARKIYLGGKKDTQTTACVACHGPKGLGIPSAKFPALSAQHAEYIASQLKAFRQYSINEQTGSDDVARDNDYEGMMRNVAKGLTTVEIEALAEYIAGLH